LLCVFAGEETEIFSAGVELKSAVPLDKNQIAPPTTINKKKVIFKKFPIAPFNLPRH